MKSGIYIIKNMINGKVYVGSAVNLNERWRMHKSQLNRNKHHSIKLQRSFNKYGIDAFEFIPIQYCEKENLITNEQFWIDKFNSSKNGYNILEIAGSPCGMKGKKHSYESKIKMSKAQIGKKLSDETKSKISKSSIGNKYCVGRKISDKVKEIFKQSAINRRGVKQSKEHAAKRGLLKRKLNYDLVIQMYKDGIRNGKIAENFNVDRHTITRIIKLYLK